MNPKLDRRLGKIWDKVREKLGSNETDKFLEVVIQAKDFDDLPQIYKDLVLEIEGRSKQKAA
jgi:F0F1-type ATP synthase delta subunit